MIGTTEIKVDVDSLPTNLQNKNEIESRTTLKKK